MNKEKVYNDLNKMFNDGGCLNGKDISETPLLTWYVIRAYQLKYLRGSEYQAGPLMGELFGEGDGENDFKKLLVALQFLKYSLEWGKEKNRELKRK